MTSSSNQNISASEQARKAHEQAEQEARLRRRDAARRIPLKNRLLTKANRDAAALLTLVAMGGVIVSGGEDKTKVTERASAAAFAENSKNALKHADRVDQTTLIIKAGAKFRYSPSMIAEAKTTQGNVDNVAGEVPEGQAYRLTWPVSRSTDPGFIGTLRPDVNFSSITSAKERAANTIWFNVAELDGQGLVQYTEDADYLTSRVPGGIDANGNVFSENDGVMSYHSQAATAESIDAAQIK